MNIKYIDLYKLQPYEFNNRTHPEEQVERIAKSIEEFGFNQPLVVDAENNIIVGHGRLLAARKLNIDKIPCIEVNDLTDEQIRAYRIIDNKLQNDSSWSFNNLELELGWLEDNDFSLKDYGLDDLRSMFPEEEPEVSEDDFEAEEPEETYIKLGDLIELGRHRVLCGSFEDSEFEADMVFADPPYGIDIVGGSKAFGSVGGCNIIKANKYPKILGDETPDLAKKAFAFINEKQPTVSIWFGANHYSDVLPDSPCWIVWDKNNTGNFADAELAWTNQKTAVRIFKHTWNGLIKESERGERRRHPTQKPIALVAWCINSYGRDIETVLDPFLGSGTTLIACEQLNRTCYGIEIEPKYCQVIIERYKKYCTDNNKPFECKINGEQFNAQEN